MFMFTCTSVWRSNFIHRTHARDSTRPPPLRLVRRTVLRSSRVRKLRASRALCLPSSRVPADIYTVRVPRAHICSQAPSYSRETGALPPEIVTKTAHVTARALYAILRLPYMRSYSLQCARFLRKPVAERPPTRLLAPARRLLHARLRLRLVSVGVHAVHVDVSNARRHEDTRAVVLGGGRAIPFKSDAAARVDAPPAAKQPPSLGEPLLPAARRIKPGLGLGRGLMLGRGRGRGRGR